MTWKRIKNKTNQKKRSPFHFCMSNFTLTFLLCCMFWLVLLRMSSTALRRMLLNVKADHKALLGQRKLPKWYYFSRSPAQKLQPSSRLINWMDARNNLLLGPSCRTPLLPSCAFFWHSVLFAFPADRAAAFIYQVLWLWLQWHITEFASFA